MQPPPASSSFSPFLCAGPPRCPNVANVLAPPHATRGNWWFCGIISHFYALLIFLPSPAPFHHSTRQNSRHKGWSTPHFLASCHHSSLLSLSLVISAQRHTLCPCLEFLRCESLIVPKDAYRGLANNFELSGDWQ